MIGSLVIIIKRLISRQIVSRIPKSNILPQHRIDEGPHSESIQMVTLHSTPRIIQVRPINEPDTGILQLQLLCQFSYFRLEDFLFFLS